MDKKKNKGGATKKGHSGRGIQSAGVRWWRLGRHSFCCSRPRCGAAECETEDDRNNRPNGECDAKHSSSFLRISGAHPQAHCQ